MKPTAALLKLALVVVIAVSAWPTRSAAAASTPTDLARINYARPFEPPTRPAFIPLPPGAVEPAGWLRDWCLAARDGFTGHMDEIDVEFKRAWAADHQMKGERLDWPKGGGPMKVVATGWMAWCAWATSSTMTRSSRRPSGV